MLPDLRICNHRQFLNTSSRASSYHHHSLERRDNAAVAHTIAGSLERKDNTAVAHTIAGMHNYNFLDHKIVEDSLDVNPSKMNGNEKKNLTSNSPLSNFCPPSTKTYQQKNPQTINKDTLFPSQHNRPNQPK